MTKSDLIVTNIAISVNKSALLVDKSALSVQSSLSVKKKVHFQSRKVLFQYVVKCPSEGCPSWPWQHMVSVTNNTTNLTTYEQCSDLSACLTACIRVCLPVCLPYWKYVRMKSNSLFCHDTYNRTAQSPSQQPNWPCMTSHSCIPVPSVYPPTTNTTIHTHTLQAVPHSLRHSDTPQTHTHTRAHVVVSGYRSRMSHLSLMHETLHRRGWTLFMGCQIRYATLPRVVRVASNLNMLSYWWMIISTNDFTSKAHRWNSDAIFEYYYHLQPLESLGHLANVTLEKDVKKGLTPLIYNLL